MMEDESNPAPVTVRVKAGPPTEALDGFTEFMNADGPIVGYEHADISSTHALTASTAIQQNLVVECACILSLDSKRNKDF